MKKVLYLCEVGDIITDVRSGKLKILEQIKIKDKNGWNNKGYKYKCLICGNEDQISESNLKNHTGCNVCCTPSQKILIGYNDIATTNKKLFKLLANKKDNYKYTEWSNKRTDFKCPNCGNIIKNKQIGSVNKHGLSCPICSDKLSYPEKFVFNILQQLLGNNFIYQLTKTTFKWCNNYRYDFYFEINNESYILETHGKQHYEGGFERMKSYKHTRDLQEEQENDRLKKELALRNGIKENNYIIIDCRESTLEWIKEHILNSRLINIFDLSKINWLECHKFACNSLVKIVCKLWNRKFSIRQIMNMMKLGRARVAKYLKQGEKLNWCNYNPNEEMKKNIKQNLPKIKKANSKKVICLNTDKIFDSITEAGKYYSIKSGIGICCQNKKVFAGINSKTGEKLQWQYYNDYLIKPKQLLSNEEIDKLPSEKKKRIICLNNKKIFNSIKRAEDYCNLKSTNNISVCCRNKTKYAGINPKTGEYLQWQYYDEYLIKPKKLLTNEEIDKITNINKSNCNKQRLNKKIICLNNNKIFKSIMDATKYYNIKSHSNISQCCIGKRSHCGKDPITNTPLRWMYYEDYLKLHNK